MNSNSTLTIDRYEETVCHEERKISDVLENVRIEKISDITVKLKNGTL